MISNCSSIEDILKSGAALIYKTKGTSMTPLLKQNRDFVRIESINVELLKENDVVLFKRDDGTYILHRIIKIYPDYLWIAGDCCLAGEDIRYDQILGKLTAIKRKNCEIREDNKYYRLYVLIWCNAWPLRMALGELYEKIKKWIRCMKN